MKEQIARPASYSLPLSLFLGMLLFFQSSLLWARPPVDENYSQNIKKDWTFLYEKDGIQVYKKEVKDGHITSFRGVGVLAVPLPILLHIIRDVEKSSLWTPNLASKKMVHEASLAEGTTMNHNTLPWPATDRETLLHSKLSYDKDRDLFVIVTRSIDLPAYPEKKDRVRGIVYDSNFIFRPVVGGTLVDLDAQIDPKGDIPHWVINFIQKKWPYTFLKSLEDYALKGSFRPEAEFVKMYEDFKKSHGMPIMAGEWDKGPKLKAIEKGEPVPSSTPQTTHNK